MLGKKLLQVVIASWLGVLFLTSINCKVSEDISGTNPVPVLSSISPSAQVAHMPSFTLTVTGSDFVQGSKIVFNGIEKVSEYVSSGELTCWIDPDDIPASAASQYTGTRDTGSEDSTVLVLVRSPTPGGGDSNALDFTVHSDHTFTDPAAITPGDASYANPALAVDDSGTLFLVYEFYDSNTNIFAIDFTRSTDNGVTWEPPYRLVQFIASGSYNPCIALDSQGNINVAYYSGGGIKFTRSEDQGMSWSTPLLLSSFSPEIVEPAMAVDPGDGINIIWPQRDANLNVPVYFTRSVDYGTTWSPPVNAFAGWQNSYLTYNPAIAADDNQGVYVTWTMWPVGGSRYSYVYSNYSHDNGATWNNIDSYFGVCSSSDIAVDPDGNVDLLLESSYLPFSNQVVFRQSQDRGVSWNIRIEVTADRFDSKPGLVIDSAGNINVIYYYNYGFFFNRSVNNGIDWGDEISLTGSGQAMDMAVDLAGNIYLVYEHDGSDQLYYLRSNQYQ
ncbi:MAG: hypothetical protein GTO45_31190 [Candidatus Aminicenantes bacterium]|nr:hypothetical protein [Candidatus Aminicenantes bacterium]NIM83264.1 hypothetical protein [Candidatus Aminicenantes bacterium]NIN22635.1 hypothetical protein [Candidatus Aminicenantes bacterium]NIN46394.1 hypothetical protein [Candidatus Aminicenantes bacterium]NIN89244.1 hypothetical protein [Candidatus Aminicenantes bacterium]